jgi:hypothetical protein
MSSGDGSAPDAALGDQVETSLTVQLVDDEQWHAVVSRLQLSFLFEKTRNKF